MPLDPRYTPASGMPENYMTADGRWAYAPPAQMAARSLGPEVERQLRIYASQPGQAIATLMGAGLTQDAATQAYQQYMQSGQLPQTQPDAFTWGGGTGRLTLAPQSGSAPGALAPQSGLQPQSPSGTLPPAGGFQPGGLNTPFNMSPFYLDPGANPGAVPGSGVPARGAEVPRVPPVQIPGQTTAIGRPITQAPTRNVFGLTPDQQQQGTARGMGGMTAGATRAPTYNVPAAAPGGWMNDPRFAAQAAALRTGQAANTASIAAESERLRSQRPAGPSMGIGGYPPATAASGGAPRPGYTPGGVSLNTWGPSPMPGLSSGRYGWTSR